MNRKTVIAVILAILGFTVLFLTIQVLREQKSAPATITDTASPAEAVSPTTPQRPPADPHDRRLIRIKRLPAAGQQEAFISYRKAINTYRLGAKLPPDQAVLAQIGKDYVILKPPAGDPIRLPLEDMPESDRLFFTEPAEIENVEDIPDPVPDDPEHRKMLDEITDPYAPCGKIKDDEARRTCERRLHAEMDEQTAACDQKDTREEALKCYEEIERQFGQRPPVEE